MDMEMEMEMERASKKRKLCHDDDQDNEEEKMEKFFALIRNIREARDRLMNGSDHALKATDDHNHITTKQRKQEEDKMRQEVSVWKPTFQREDFLEDQARQFKNPLAAVTLVDSSQRKEVTDLKEENKEDLDLRLSL